MRFRTALLCTLIFAPCGRATAQPQEEFGRVVGTFPIEAAAGKRVKFTGYIMTEGITDGFASLWWRADKGDKVAVFDNMADRAAAGNAKWRRYELQLSMPRDITNINFGLLHPGNGSAWFADLKIEINKEPYTTDQFDLTLTSAPPRGFEARGEGYEFVVDSLQLHEGKPSLRIRRIR